MAEPTRRPRHARPDPDQPATPGNNDDPFITGYASSPAETDPVPPSPTPPSGPRRDMRAAADDSDLPAERRTRTPFDPAENTSLHEVIRKYWQCDEITELHLRRLRQVADLNTAKGTENGFTLETASGKKIKWEPLHSDGEGNPAREAITGDKKNFDMDSAKAIIALARVRGWDTINVQGNTEQKDMLWFATQVQGLREREQHLAAGKPDSEFKAPRVANHMPDANSKYRQEWERMLADWESKNASKIGRPGVTEAEPVPGVSQAAAPAGPVSAVPDAGRRGLGPRRAAPVTPDDTGADPASRGARRGLPRLPRKEERPSTKAAAAGPALPASGVLTPTYNAAAQPPEQGKPAGPHHAATDPDAAKSGHGGRRSSPKHAKPR